MSKINELKQHNPDLNKSIIDILFQVFEKSKYVEMIIRLFKNKQNSLEFLGEIKDILVKDFELPKEVVESFSVNELFHIYLVLDNIGRTNVSNLKKFIDYNERKLIHRSDLSTYKSFEDLENQISLAELKLIDKELQSQVEILYSADEWLVLKPLSYESSLKYGASTKWCTAMKKDPEYFSRYSRRGIVIYCINRSTGEKIAAFKNLNPDYEKETSFWDVKDNRLDSMETNLPNHILDIIKYQFSNVFTTNWELMSQDVKEQLENIYSKEELILGNEVNMEQPNVPMNQGGLGLAIRRAITYDEAVETEYMDEGINESPMSEL
jgi:hypothetical protein